MGPVWLTHGMRGPGTAGSEEAQEGSAQLEVALPSRLDDQVSVRVSGGCMQQQAERVVIGMDPHKRSVTIEVMTADETVVGGGRFGTDQAGFAAMTGYVNRLRPAVADRVWAVEGCNGMSSRPGGEALDPSGASSPSSWCCVTSWPRS